MDGSLCANSITASGCSTMADSGGAAPPNSRIRLRAVAGHSWSQCSSVTGAPWQCGQVAEKSASTMFRYATSLWQWPLRSWARRTESFLDRETGARLPLKTALVLSWIMAGSIVSLFVKALAGRLCHHPLPLALRLMLPLLRPLVSYEPYMAGDPS